MRFSIALIVGAAVFFHLINSSLAYQSPLIWLIAIVAVYGLARSVARNYIAARILKSYPPPLDVKHPGDLGSMAASLELDGADNIKLLSEGEGLKVYSLTFDLYKRTRHGEYLAKQSYYTMLEIRLHRQLPHILFDSKTAKNSQFKKLYLKSQRISVQGGFDVMFDTYVPPYYTIDSLSFITPEVMEALVAARDYDIEILDDRLLVYAPLLSFAELEELKSRGKLVADELNDNIDTYRDNRLSGADRRTKVTPFARSLLRNPTPMIVTSVALGLLTLAIVAAMATLDGGIKLLEPLIFILIGTIGTAVHARNIVRTNDRALESYRLLHLTDRGKPIDADKTV